MIGAIVAMTDDGVIGKDGTLPWHYSADLKRFKKLTMGSTIVMGRKTWESLPKKKPLPGRRNIVITRSNIPDVDCFRNIEDALNDCTGDVWLIGGARLFEQGLAYCDIIDITYVPDKVEGENIVRLDNIAWEEWDAGPVNLHEDDERLKHQIFTRRSKT